MWVGDKRRAYVHGTRGVHPPLGTAKGRPQYMQEYLGTCNAMPPENTTHTQLPTMLTMPSMVLLRSGQHPPPSATVLPAGMAQVSFIHYQPRRSRLLSISHGHEICALLPPSPASPIDNDKHEINNSNFCKQRVISCHSKIIASALPACQPTYPVGIQPIP